LSQEIGSDLKKALGCRLHFRAQFLKIADMADTRTPTNIKEMWSDLLAALPQIKASAYLGKPVPSSFSTKIQRRLASTVPPRPIVQVSQEAAFEHLERLCRDASVVVEVLKYYDSHSLMVCALREMTLQS
jgi:N-alpha-acetyltransferase 35, NatC auxiliary subunit